MSTAVSSSSSGPTAGSDGRGSDAPVIHLDPVRRLVQADFSGEERAVPGEKLQILLATLLFEANRPVSIERLIDELWGDRPPATARESIHAHVARLRRVLTADGSASPLRNARAATPNDPATMRIDFRIPKIPAVAIAPTPTNRT